MKNTLIALFITVSCFFFESCKKYLDVTPDNVATLNSSFANANETEAFLFGCFAPLQSLADIRHNPGFTSSGEIIYTPGAEAGFIGDLGPGGTNGFKLMQGLQNTIDPLLNFWDGTQSGINLWQAIRNCNTFLASVNIPQDLSQQQKTRWIAEAKFLKAFYTFWLIRMYGPVPIADEALPVSAGINTVRVEQQPVDSCFNYVVKLLNEAITDLPAIIQNPAAENGRITSTINLAVKAEVLATAASPLFNGNPDYASFVNKKGENLFSTSQDPAKWQRAAEACKAAIDAATASGASLYQLRASGNIVHMSDSTKQLLTLQGAFVDSWNPEQIWTLNPTFRWQAMAAARLIVDGFQGVYSVFSVPLGQSEIFYTNHGVPINEDKTWDYSKRHEIKTGDDANIYYIKKGYSTSGNNFNREPRYYADIAFNGSNWFGAGNTNDNSPNYINAVDGPAAPYDNQRYNVTGYWPKKLVPYQTTFGTYSVVENYSWPFIRLTGLWLLYAECLNEVNGPGSEVYTWIDKVRERAGLEGVVQSWANYSRTPGKPLNKDGLREIIHRERRIELAFEGQAGWDLRRWKELQNVLTVPFLGWDAVKNTPTGYYQLKTVYQPIFGLKDYLFPISDNDLLQNPNLVQTPYW